MKTVVITGASQGLGLHIAASFAANGWKVIGTGRSERPSELDSAVEYRQFSASSAADSAAFWESIKDGLQAEVCLVNNAGGYVSGGLLETSAEDFDKQMQSTYFSAVYMTRGLAGVVPKARIINVISTSALAAHANNSAYGAAKAAEMHFFQALQKEFETSKYQITNLYPSYIDSHGDNPKAISATDLADFIVSQADSDASYYLPDVTLRPR